MMATMTLDKTIEYFRDLAFGDNTISPEHKRWLEDITEWLGKLKIQQSYKPVDKEFYDYGYNKGIDDFAEALIPRLTDAIYPKDVEGMRNLINDVAEQLKEGETDG